MVYQFKLKKTRNAFCFIVAETDKDAIKEAQQQAKEFNDKLVEVWRAEDGRFVSIAIFL